MAKLIILGSSNALSSMESENTHMLLVGEERIVMVDCVNSSIHRLSQVGVDFMNVTDLILTHFHPDHVSGTPLLLMDMWLRGRDELINIYGLHDTIDRMGKMMDLYSWESWPDFFPVAFHHLPSSEKIQLLDCAEFKITSSPVQHLIPTIGLRFDFKTSQKALAYSCDTEPCDEVVRLAQGAEILFHEATGESMGHSSAGQAGEIAATAGVSQLYLIHYPTGEYARDDLIAEAKEHFQGKVDLATDFMALEFE